MKLQTVKACKMAIPLALLTLISWWCGSAWAADAASGAGAENGSTLSRGLAYLQSHFNRATWDYVMRWVNFAILAGVIFKYARTPLINFLQEKKADTARELQRFEAQKQAAEEKIREGQIRLEASKERLAMIQERIIAEGKKQKEDMIQEAKQESRMMLSAARARINNQIQEVARTIKHDMIDAAFEKALERLPQEVTAADQERLLNQWMDEAAKETAA